MKSIVLFGSTGSIGTQTLDVVRKMPEHFRVAALAAGGQRMELLRSQIREFAPLLTVVYDEKAAEELRQSPEGKMTVVRFGMEGLLEAAAMPEADTAVTAMVGMIGLEPTVRAIECGKTIALANKETLVCAGEYIMQLAAKHQVPILPVDSEHCAIFQCLLGENREELEKIWITASGGPFRGRTWEQLERVTPEQAMAHPVWAMGAKITIDSATLMNKGLEMIEARWLFGTEKIQPIIHPQSIVHSMVEYKDGTVMAQLGVPDMRLPIEVALLYPERGPRLTPPLDLIKASPLTFEAVDEKTFPSVRMAREVLQCGGLFPAVYNAANERAVRRFLNRTIGFTDIFREVEQALERFDKKENSRRSYTLEEVLTVQQWIEE